VQGRLGISKDTPVRVQVRTERVSCKWKAEDRYRCRRGRNDFSLCVGGHGRKLEHQGGTRNMRAWAQGCHGPGKCCQVASDFFRLAVALSVSNSPDQWLDWDTRRKLLQRRGCSFFMLQQAIVSLRDALESRLHSGVVLPRFSLCNQQLHLLVWASDWWLRLPPGVGVERGRLQQFWQTRAQKKKPKKKEDPQLFRSLDCISESRVLISTAGWTKQNKPSSQSCWFSGCYLCGLVWNVTPSSPKSIFWDAVTSQTPLWVLLDAGKPCSSYLLLHWNVFLKPLGARSNSRMPSKKVCCVLRVAMIVIL